MKASEFESKYSYNKLQPSSFQYSPIELRY